MRTVDNEFKVVIISNVKSQKRVLHKLHDQMCVHDKMCEPRQDLHCCSCSDQRRGMQSASSKTEEHSLGLSAVNCNQLSPPPLKASCMYYKYSGYLVLTEALRIDE